ncbi:MAG: hypothetical protein ABSB87_09245 [Terriglobales bacterium]|jgi:hypothetical protein
MLDGRVRNKKWELRAPHQVSQQECIFSTQRDGVKQTSLDWHGGAPNREPSRVQVSHATIGLQHLTLQGSQPQVFGSAHESGAISNKTQLKTIMLRLGRDGGCQGGKTIRLQPAVCVHK